MKTGKVYETLERLSRRLRDEYVRIWDAAHSS